MVEVTEADKQMVADYLASICINMPNLAALILANESALARCFATHREAAAKAERDRIVAWLRADADQTEIEAESILAKLELPDLERGAWQSLVATKRGIANAIAALESQP